MKEEIRVDPALQARPANFRRLSWQAVFGGLIIAMAVALLLSVLMVSIGATVIYPMSQQNPGRGAGIGVAIGWIVISIISLFAGGWVAGRMSGMGRSSEGAVHGLVTWGAAAVLAVYLATSAAGSILGGMGKLLGQVLPIAGQIATAGIESEGGVGPAVNNVMNSGLNTIHQEARNISQKNAPEPTGRTDENQPGQNPNQSSKQLIAALDRMFSHGDNINPNDREAVVNILTTQDNMSAADANQTVDRWIQTYQQSKANINQTASRVGQVATQGISMAGWWCFIALVLGAIAAAWGGSRGALAFWRAREQVTVVP